MQTPETLSPAQQATPERPHTAIDLEQAVMQLAVELDDPHSDLYAAFYGPDGIEPTPLATIRRPAHGHVLLAKDETNHYMEAGGTTYNAATFKRRGAFLAATLAERANPELEDFITASAGNHALGVAFAAKLRGKQAHIYCRQDISDVKLQKLLALGAKVHDEYDTLEAAMAAAQFAAESDPAYSSFIHPYDQTEVIAGQATIGLEMLHELEARAQNGQFNLHQDPIEVLVPIGGGGLIAGVSVVFKQAKDAGLIGENVRVVGVHNEQPTPWCDGTNVNQPGELASLALSDAQYVQVLEPITELDLANAMHELAGVYNKCIEPAGALAYAGAKKRAARTPQPRDGSPTVTFVPIVSGANVTKETYDYFSQLRAQDYANRMAGLALLAKQKRPAVAADPLAARGGSRGAVLRGAFPR